MSESVPTKEPVSAQAVAIKNAGGIGVLARRIGISQPSVSNWSRIPADRVLAVEAVTGVHRSIIFGEVTGDLSVNIPLQRWSGAGLVIYAMTVTFAGVDWIMSLNPHWFSTLFGFIFVGGQGLSALAFTIVVSTFLARTEPMNTLLKRGLGEPGIDENLERIFARGIDPDTAQETFRACYPFHPSVISVFERKWQSLPRFQRTRGILRLLALWVAHAYQGATEWHRRRAVV